MRFLLVVLALAAAATDAQADARAGEKTAQLCLLCHRTGPIYGAGIPLLEGRPAAELAAAITDYYDGKLARSRTLVTDLGRLLDPLADKLLLLCTLGTMWWLMRGVPLLAPLPAADEWAVPGVIGPVMVGAQQSWPVVAPWGLVGLPLWVVLVVLGREALMTVFRQFAARRGVIISAIGPAKWKTGFQSTWAGAAFFWFFAAAAAVEDRWTSDVWRYVARERRR